MDPAQEYQARLAHRSEAVKAYEKKHIRTGNLRLLFFIVLLALVAVFCRSGLGVGIGLLILTLGLFLSGMVHDRVLRAREMAQRAVSFYTWALERLSDAWVGKGSGGTEFL